MPQLELHGPPCLRRTDGRVLALAPREAALLAWLHLEGPTPRAALAGRLWPGGAEAKARANLRQTLLRLKRAAGSALLAEDVGMLRLAPGVHVAAAGSARLLGSLEFDDAPDLAAWLAQRRDAAQRDLLRERMTAARGHLDRGELDAALAAADALLAADPAVEEAHRVRMEVHYLRGDPAAAIGAWDACRDALRTAFGIAPSAITDALGRLALAGAGPAAPAPGGRGALSAALPAALRRPPRLVGREAVLADILRALSLGQAVVLAGPGGIGKSRLLAEAAGAAAPGDAALIVGGRPGDALLPGAVLARLLGTALARYLPTLDAATQQGVRQLLPEGGDETQALRSALAQRRLLGTLPRVLQACRARGLRLLAVDDLQFADEFSLAALQLLVGVWRADSPGQALLPLFSVRPDEAPPAAQAVLDLLAGSERAARFDLAPLEAADVRALLDSLPWAEVGRTINSAVLAPQLLSRVGGNPAWLLECLKGLWLDGLPGAPLPLPPSLREAVRQRLQRLPDGALQLAQLAAVAGGDFSLPLAGAALSRSPLQLAPLLSALESAQVFQGLGFSHDLVADAVLHSLPAALRPLLHQDVAAHLVARQGAPAAIAHHLQQAGDATAAAPWWLEAAGRARRRWQMAEAAAAYQAAAPALPDRAARLDAWLSSTRCWLWSRHDAAGETLAAAEALVASPVEAARLRTVRAIWCFNQRRLGDAVGEATALMDDYERHAASLHPSTLADGIRVITSLAASGVDIERALALVDRLLPFVDGDADARLALQAARGGLLHWAAQPVPAAAALERALDQAEDDGDPGPRVVCGNQLMRVRHALGDLAGAAACGVRVLQRAEPLDMGLVFQTDVMHVLAMIEVASGRAAAGLDRFDALLGKLADAGTPVPDAFLTSQALAFIAVGRLAAAEAVLRRHPAPGRPGQALQDLGLHAAQARLAAAQERSAQRWLAQVAAPMALPPGLVLQRRVILASLQGGAPDDLAELVQQLGDRGLAALQRVAAQAAARSALAGGLHDMAVAQARLALQLEAHVDAWVDEPATAWHTAAQVFAACGLRDDAAAAARRGAAWVREGAAPWRQAAQREAWLRGNRVHRELLAMAGPA